MKKLQRQEAVFIATDFLDIADYETARKTLNRLDSYGKIKKICRGIYYKPKFSELLGEYEAVQRRWIASFCHEIQAFIFSSCKIHADPFVFFFYEDAKEMP